MSIKFYNPVTPSMRGLKLIDKSSLYKGKPLKVLSSGLNQKSGRNNKYDCICFTVILYNMPK